MWRAVFYKISFSRKMVSKGLRKCHLQYLTLAQANKDPSISGVNFLGRRTFFCRISRKKSKIAEIGVRETLFFRGLNMVEYLSDLNEK